MGKTYTDEELILELQRFYDENGRVPKRAEMQVKFGYPSYNVYTGRFGSHNNALEIANLPLNKYNPKLDGTEVCSYCGKRSDEIPNFVHWLYPDGIRYCTKHGSSNYEKFPAYVIGNLDINSSKGLGRAGEILVVKTLKIGNEHDCNRISCGYSFDMYHEKYGKIDVKTGLLSYVSNSWFFNFNAKKIVETYICIGLSLDRSIVEHVWVVSNENGMRNLTGLRIKNTFDSLFSCKHWEVDSKPYNDIWQEMIVNYQLGKCKIFR